MLGPTLRSPRVQYHWRKYTSKYICMTFSVHKTTIYYITDKKNCKVQQQWRSQRWVWGVQTPPIENRCVFVRLNNWQKTRFKLAFVQNQSTQCMCIHSQSHLLPIRFTICMNLLHRRAINIKFGHAKFYRKFSGRNTTPTDPHQRDFEPPPLQISGYTTVLQRHVV